MHGIPCRFDAFLTYLDQLRVSHLTEQITLVSLNNSPCTINVDILRINSESAIRCIMTSIDILFTDKSKI